VPVLIASILAWLESSATSGGPAPKVPVAIADLDGTPISRAVIERLRGDSNVRIQETTPDNAAEQVRNGSMAAAIVLPKGFGKQATAGFSGGEKADVQLITDPAKPIEAQVVQGSLMQQASAAVATAVYGPFAGDGSAPLKVTTVSGAVKQVTWGAAAHRYSGFGLQGLLFFAVEAAVGLSRERRQGIWKRLRSTPVPPGVFILSRGVSSTVMAFVVILLIFGAGALLFKIRILGSSLGFLAVALSTALMAASFGLMFAAIGKTETQNRALAILAILVMLATGGAWFPLAQMPEWVQTIAKFLPVRWAVDGFDGATWRGQSLQELMTPVGILLLFSIAYSAVAVLRFRYSAEPSA